MADRPYLSIGEVLSLLKQEFPDITISKIRFLESQGLLDPERTPSGYRKFYDADVDRLRWILRQQREHYLPLKVIKGRLTPGGHIEDEDAAESADAVSESREQGARVDANLEPELRPPRVPDHVATPRPVSDPAPDIEPREETTGADVQAEPSPAEPAPAESRSGTVAEELPRPAPAGDAVRAAAWESDANINLTFEELAVEVGITEGRLAELEKYGLLSGKAVGGTPYYDNDAVNVARVAAGFLRFGVEARHLRMYKSAAEREAGLFEQIIVPMLKQRNPEARRRAMEAIVELTRLGESLRDAMLRQALKEYTSR